jgi:hypothetical protein
MPFFYFWFGIGLFTWFLVRFDYDMGFYGDFPQDAVEEIVMFTCIVALGPITIMVSTR